MPTDLLDLPGYPGHAQARTFAEDCARNIPENTLDDAGALQAELSRRAALLSTDQVTALDASHNDVHLKVGVGGRSEKLVTLVVPARSWGEAVAEHGLDSSGDAKHKPTRALVAVSIQESERGRHDGEEEEEY